EPREPLARGGCRMRGCHRGPAPLGGSGWCGSPHPPARAGPRPSAPYRAGGGVVEPLSINGEPPQLDGQRCDAILCQEYWHGGRLVEPANVAFLCFEGRWYRLYFDFGIVCWRDTEGGPEPYEAPEIDSDYPVVDVAKQRGL